LRSSSLSCSSSSLVGAENIMVESMRGRAAKNSSCLVGPFD
jgi:hypothetical protein